MKRLAVLGCTGSIGESVLSLVDLYPDRFQVATLAAGSNWSKLATQVQRYSPRAVALHSRTAARQLSLQFPNLRVLSGDEGVIDTAVDSRVDVVVAGITGAAGLRSTYQALVEGKQVALANKEALVMAGRLMTATAAGGPGLLPIDSEHSAIHQCLRGVELEGVQRLLLTASGGPFLHFSAEQLRTVSVGQALNHPTWDMGSKISIDSATLMNKGLEVIEAHYLFGVSAEAIQVVVHPQSIVHSMVEFVDGNVLAQLGITDMRSAILYALCFPDRCPSDLPSLDLFNLSPLEFLPPDLDRFPCLKLAYEALASGKSFPTVLNASNEVAVKAFLQGRIPFLAISRLVEEALSDHQAVEVSELDQILAVDRRVRRQTEQRIQ